MAYQRPKRFQVPREPDQEIGKVMIKLDVTSNYHNVAFVAGTELAVSKVMLSPTGLTYYKVLGSPVWVSSHEATMATNINVGHPRLTSRSYQKVYAVS
jgi:hypothetical protein